MSDISSAQALMPLTDNWITAHAWPNGARITNCFPAGSQHWSNIYMMSTWLGKYDCMYYTNIHRLYMMFAVMLL